LRRTKRHAGLQSHLSILWKKKQRLSLPLANLLGHILFSRVDTRETATAAS
jgi:hypothetical protein